MQDIYRDSWGHSYLTVRGEIIGFVKDGLLRKQLPRMFSLIPRLHYPGNSWRLPETFGDSCKNKTSFLWVFVENCFLP